MPYAVTNPCGAKTRNEDANGETCTMPAGFRTDHPGQGRCYLHSGNARLTHGRYSKIKRAALVELIQEYKEDPEILNMEPELATARALFEDYINRYDEITDALLAWHHSFKEVVMTRDRVDMLKQIVSRYEDTIQDRSDVPEFMHSYVKATKSLISKFYEYFDTAANFKPIQILDVAESYKFLAEITKIVERIEKVRAQNAISRKNFIRVMTEMGRVVNTTMDVAGTGLHFFDPLGNPIKVYTADGTPIDISAEFQKAKAKIQEQWLTIRVE